MVKQTKTPLNLEPLLSPEETASILGVTTGTLSVWRSNKRYSLPYVKSGSRVMYRSEDIQAFIASRLKNGQGDELIVSSSAESALDCLMPDKTTEVREW